MRHGLRDKHRPTADYFIIYNVKLIKIIIKNLFFFLRKISLLNYKQRFVIIAKTIDRSLFSESNENHKNNV